MGQDDKPVLSPLVFPFAKRPSVQRLHSQQRKEVRAHGRRLYLFRLAVTGKHQPIGIKRVGRHAGHRGRHPPIVE